MSHTFWYASRGTGVAATILLTLVVALGVGGSLRLRSDRWPRFLVVGLHRNLTLLTLAFLAGHIVTTVADSFTPIGIRDAFIPFLASYRPIWLGLGAVALDLLLALTVTSLLRARLGYRAWRAVHWLAYAAWPVALAHGLGTGSDVRFGWMQLLTAACVLLVAAAVLGRLYRADVDPAPRLVAAAAVGAVLLGGFLWYRGGPGATGWAARAGTPSSLLAHVTLAKNASAATTSPATPQQPVADLPTPPFTARLSGRLTQGVDAANGLVRIDIRTRTSGDVNGRLWIRLEGEPAGGGGVSLTASGVHFGPTSAPDLYAGTVRALQGTELLLGLRNAEGKRISVDVRLSLGQATGTVHGTLRAAAATGDSE